MDFVPFLQEMLGITQEFGIVRIEKIERPEKIIRIYLDYISSEVLEGGRRYTIYDKAPEREWQHLSWFEYKCYLVCKLPRYVDRDKKVKTFEPKFAPKGCGYTHLFAKAIIDTLQHVRVQKTVADLFQTTPYIVRSIMENAVEKGLEVRGLVTNLVNVSIDEKAYAKGHEYATILIDSDKEYIVDMHEGRKEKSLKTLLALVSGQEAQPRLQRANMDMWEAYSNVIEEVAPQALIVHDKFHVIKKISEAIDKTRRQEVKTDERLKQMRYVVLKNEENRTKQQQDAFKIIDEENVKTAQAWHIRENFKYCWNYATKHTAEKLLTEWMEQSRNKKLFYINKVIRTIENHKQGILNGFITKTDSALHENKNSFLQSIIAKARGFINFERFRINALFYFGNLKLIHH